jgi:hypothetical protein
MKIQENYFYKLDNSKEVKVIWKKYDKANILEIGIEYPTAIVDLDRFSGIPITEKWLKDFGYFIIETNKCVEAFKQNFRYSIQQVENSNHWFWCDGETVITNLEFIHELQDLYFALSREDLVVSNSVS